MKCKKMKIVTSSAAILAMGVALLVGCGSGSGGGQKQTAAEAEANTGAGSEISGGGAAKDGLPTLTILRKGSSRVDGHEDNRVLEAMAEKIGARVKIVGVDSDKFNVMMASGDGYDMIMTQPSNFAQLINGGAVLPMDELYDKYGADIESNAANVVAFSKKKWSADTGHLYFLPVQVGLDSVGADTSQGPLTRWDYYKELGAPETKNLDEWLDMLAKMQQAHPKTESGLPVYGVSMFTDWGIWCYKYPLACYLGFNEISGTNLDLYSVNDMEYHNMLEEEGLYFQSIDYFHKANKLGLLDPDAFITNYDDFVSKATNGQILTGPTTWAMGSFNADHADEAVGFEVIPTSWSQQWGGADYKMGWTDKCYGINAKSQYPELCMKLINYVYSYDGARTLYSGIEGVDWNMVDGVPTLTQENIDFYSKNNGSEAWLDAGFGWDGNCIGLGTYKVNPKDGKTLDLFNDPSIYPNLLRAVQKDYSEHYGVAYPDQAMQAAREKYGTYDQSGTDAYTVAIMGAAPDEIMRKEARLTEEAIARASELILASDADYEGLKAAALQSFKDMGLDDVMSYYKEAWSTAKTEAAQFK